MASKPPFVGKKRSLNLSEIALVKAGNVAPKSQRFSDSGIPFVRAGSLSALLAGIPISSLEKIESSVAEELGMRLFPKGTVLFAKSGMSCMTGNVYMLPEPCYVVSHLACVMSDDELLSQWLLHFFRYNKPSSLNENPSFPSIKLSKLSSIEVMLPNQEEMFQGVQTLNAIEEQNELCKEQIKKLDQLIKSRFVEMFGDGRWAEQTIGDLAVDIRYGTSKKASDSGRHKYLRMNNMTDNGELDFKDIKYIDLEEDELKKCQVVKGDLLFNRTNSREKVGKTAVFLEEEPMVVAGYIIRVRLGEKILSEYLSTFMNLPTTKALLKTIAKGAVHQANINSQELAAIEVPVPPIELQKRFIDFIRQVDKSRFGDYDGLRSFNSLLGNINDQFEKSTTSWKN